MTLCCFSSNADADFFIFQIWSKKKKKKTWHAHVEQVCWQIQRFKNPFSDLTCSGVSSGRTPLAAWMHHAFLSVWLTLSCDSPHREEQFYQTDNMKENSVFPHLLLTWTERLSLFLRCFYLLQWLKKGEKSDAVLSKTNTNRLKGLPHMDRCARGKDTHTHTRLIRFQLLLWIQIVRQIAVKMARRTRRKNSQSSSERGERERYQEHGAPPFHAWIHIVAHNQDMTWLHWI